MSLLTRLFRIQYKHTNSKGIMYRLFWTDVTLRSVGDRPAKVTRIYFFNKLPLSDTGIGKKKHPAYEVPKGKRVNENPRNGFLTIAPIDKKPYYEKDEDDE